MRQRLPWQPREPYVPWSKRVNPDGVLSGVPPGIVTPNHNRGIATAPPPLPPIVRNPNKAQRRSEAVRATVGCRRGGDRRRVHWESGYIVQGFSQAGKSEAVSVFAVSR